MENWLFDGEGVEFHHFQRAKQVQNQAETNRLLREQNALLRRAEQDRQNAAKEQKKKEARDRKRARFEALPKCGYCSETLQAKVGRCPKCKTCLRWKRCSTSEAPTGGLNAGEKGVVWALDLPSCPDCGGTLRLKCPRCEHCGSNLDWDGDRCIRCVTSDSTRCDTKDTDSTGDIASPVKYVPRAVRDAEQAKLEYIDRTLAIDVMESLAALRSLIVRHLSAESAPRIFPAHLFRCVRDGVGIALVDLVLAADMLITAAREIAFQPPDVAIAMSVQEFLWNQLQGVAAHRKDLAFLLAKRDASASLHSALRVFLADDRAFGGACPHTANAGVQLMRQAAAAIPELSGLEATYSKTTNAMKRIAYVRR